MKFTALLHHVSIGLLRESYYRLKRQAAAGIDGMKWAEYEEDRESRLATLHRRVHRGGYRAKPARRVHIPKAGGTERTLSIWCLEDKIVQQALMTVLSAVYEVDFLGFTHYCTIARSNGRFMVGRKTVKKRMRSQLLEIKHQLRKRLHDPVNETGAWLRRVLQGHLNYYAVPGNSRSLQYFFNRVWRYWMRSLRRRSQRHRMSWLRYDQLWARFAPRILILHAYPAQRFDAKTQGRSPVR